MNSEAQLYLIAQGARQFVNSRPIEVIAAHYAPWFNVVQADGVDWVEIPGQWRTLEAFWRDPDTGRRLPRIRAARLGLERALAMYAKPAQVYDAPFDRYGNLPDGAKLVSGTRIALPLYERVMNEPIGVTPDIYTDLEEDDTDEEKTRQQN